MTGPHPAEDEPSLARSGRPAPSAWRQLTSLRAAASAPATTGAGRRVASRPWPAAHPGSRSSRSSLPSPRARLTPTPPSPAAMPRIGQTAVGFREWEAHPRRAGSEVPPGQARCDRDNLDQDLQLYSTEMIVADSKMTSRRASCSVSPHFSSCLNDLTAQAQRLRRWSGPLQRVVRPPAIPWFRPGGSVLPSTQPAERATSSNRNRSVT
jgi:hypothetical protein